MKLTKRHIGLKLRFENIVYNEKFEGIVKSLSRFNAEIETVNGIGIFSRDEIRIIGLSWK